MSSGHTSLDTAANERKARLAKLASLKRKRPHSEADVDTSNASGEGDQPEKAAASKHISGRNYDVETRGPKLGFEQNIAGQAGTAEYEAAELSRKIAEAAVEEELDADRGLDLFKLQPKKPNWDLKRDLAERMKPLDIRTQNAIAKLVRSRIENAKKGTQKSAETGKVGEEGEEIGVEGNVLVEAVHLREKELEDQVRKDRLADQEDDVP